MSDPLRRGSPQWYREMGVVAENAMRLMTAKSPFTPMAVPRLEEVKTSKWELLHQEGTLIRGYFSGINLCRENWALVHVKNKRRTVWMSVTPMELESQAHHVLSAKGDVLIGGCGLGIAAWNCAMKPEVRSVTVVERDPEIIELVSGLATRFDWQDWWKVSFVQGDILTMKPTVNAWDVALIDIWPTVGDSRLRRDMQKIAARFVANEYAAWGMELDFVGWLAERDIHPDDVGAHHWGQYSRAVGFPLINPHPDMAQLSLRAAEQVMNY